MLLKVPQLSPTRNLWRLQLPIMICFTIIFMANNRLHHSLKDQIYHHLPITSCLPTCRCFHFQRTEALLNRSCLSTQKLSWLSSEFPSPPWTISTLQLCSRIWGSIPHC